ncbi:type I-F CRISPR-associated protein Csy3 [Endozoicomonas gorgoniicola]|uniref:Type I-F CRISPR-associated protein Csy3 n=1 Tax=Endozoicomonas gorgoniicola TaxID=1234144 RepID=A0ABT3N2S0_9GAMM|nr:type I-F CRISPR-associated protein Csy3 [Endozoicomonas gorgoniicola]MCW7555932.1 type I-F CRISPR-associated protein Csy3 [Endozoicomonas gorgoniicola]
MIELCNQLSQIRSLFFSPAFFKWVHKKTQEEIPLECRTRTILGLRDGYSKAYKKDGQVKNDLTRLELSYGNPQTIDECFLSPEAEHVIVSFSLQICALTQELHTCSDPEVRRVLLEFAVACKKIGVYEELAKRYLLNIFMGRWLWMNQRTRSTEISLTDMDDECLYTVSDVQRRRWTGDMSGFEENYQKLIDRFALALTDEQQYWDIVVEAKLKFRPMAEIFPSQTFSSGSEKDRSRIYATFRLGEREQLIFTSHKTSAAIHTIDDWFPGAEEWLRVSAFGSDRSNATAHRHPETGHDVYSIMRLADELTEFINSGKKIDTKNMNKIYYLAAMFVCGGMRQVGEE